MSIDGCDGHQTGGDGSFRLGDDQTLVDVITEYIAASRRSNEIAADFRLDDPDEHHLVGTSLLHGPLATPRRCI
ncbi:hypothetical protein [Mycobacterium sp.]|jgi:hypothetical protein|uniref:hypothetical protein n=1 Tax=Mycobacterium sp. TaxID=1785 RepID=UPI00260F7C5F|nr:hypothetical protein [Mycobacterium sp.]